MKNMTLLAAITFGLSAMSAQAQQVGGLVEVPIMAGGDGWDACGSGGDVVGLDPHGDGFLSVRSGPGGQRFREIDRLYNGMHVKICDERGPWFGVVYSHDGYSDKCGVERSWPTRLPYTGPCRYGWIFGRYVGNRAD